MAFEWSIANGQMGATFHYNAFRARYYVWHFAIKIIIT